LKQQLEKSETERNKDQERFETERKKDQERFEQVLKQVLTQSGNGTAATTTPTFSPFDSTSELWTDYYARFITFIGTNSVPEGKQAQVFLTNQSATIYKLLANLAQQQTPPKEVNAITL